jgi:archaellum biogenesis protein FlaJ (TadC family)
MISAFLSEFEKIYRVSGLHRPLEEYYERSKIVLFSCFIGSYFFFTFLHILFRVQGPKVIFGTFALSSATTALLAGLVVFYPLYNKDLIESDISKSLLNSVMFMLQLSKSGLSIERIIERVAKTESNEAIQNYLNKFMVNIKIYGLNPQESISDISRRSASELFTKLMNGILTTIQTSGDLDKFFEYETSQLIQRRDEENVALLNNIGFISEIYVTILVIAPLLMIILLTTFSFASGSSSGASGINSLNLVVFAGIPIISAVLIILVDMQVSVD